MDAEDASLRADKSPGRSVLPSKVTRRIGTAVALKFDPLRAAEELEPPAPLVTAGLVVAAKATDGRATEAGRVRVTDDVGRLLLLCVVFAVVLDGRAVDRVAVDSAGWAALGPLTSATGSTCFAIDDAVLMCRRGDDSARSEGGLSTLATGERGRNSEEREEVRAAVDSSSRGGRDAAAVPLLTALRLSDRTGAAVVARGELMNSE